MPATATGRYNAKPASLDSEDSMSRRTMSMLAKQARTMRMKTMRRLPSSWRAWARISLVVRLKKINRHWAQKTREKTSQRIMVLRRGVMFWVLIKSQTMVQESRAMKILLMGWRLVKNRERGERAGMVVSVFAVAFSNG